MRGRVAKTCIQRAGSGTCVPRRTAEVVFVRRGLFMLASVTLPGAHGCHTWTLSGRTLARRGLPRRIYGRNSARFRGDRAATDSQRRCSRGVNRCRCERATLSRIVAVASSASRSVRFPLTRVCSCGNSLADRSMRIACAPSSRRVEVDELGARVGNGMLQSSRRPVVCSPLA